MQAGVACELPDEDVILTSYSSPKRGIEITTVGAEAMLDYAEVILSHVNVVLSYAEAILGYTYGDESGLCGGGIWDTKGLGRGGVKVSGGGVFGTWPHRASFFSCPSAVR